MVTYRTKGGHFFYLPLPQIFSNKFLDNLQSWRYNLFRYGFTNP